MCAGVAARSAATRDAMVTSTRRDLQDWWAARRLSSGRFERGRCCICSDHPHGFTPLRRDHGRHRRASSTQGWRAALADGTGRSGTWRTIGRFAIGGTRFRLTPGPTALTSAGLPPGRDDRAPRGTPFSWPANPLVRPANRAGAVRLRPGLGLSDSCPIAGNHTGASISGPDRCHVARRYGWHGPERLAPGRRHTFRWACWRIGSHRCDSCFRPSGNPARTDARAGVLVAVSPLRSARGSRSTGGPRSPVEVPRRLGRARARRARRRRGGRARETPWC